MRYEQPNMDIIEIRSNDIVITSVNNAGNGFGDEYNMNPDW